LQTFIMCGWCPYFEKCVFLHDQRAKSYHSVVLCRGNPAAQQTAVKDTFYWPDMNLLKVLEKRDQSYLPSTNQEYNFTMVSGNRHVAKPSMHDQAVYSIWNHFIQHLNAPGDSDAHALTNSFTGRDRLAVFVELCQGQSDESSTATVTVQSPGSKSTKSVATREPLRNITNVVTAA
jgi:hypothetical protein